MQHNPNILELRIRAAELAAESIEISRLTNPLPLKVADERAGLALTYLELAVALEDVEDVGEVAYDVPRSGGSGALPDVDRTTLERVWTLAREWDRKYPPIKSPSRPNGGTYREQTDELFAALGKTPEYLRKQRES